MKEVQELVGIVPWTFVAQICNLFLTVFLVKKFLFDRINKVVEERKQKSVAIPNIFPNTLSYYRKSAYTNISETVSQTIKRKCHL